MKFPFFVIGSLLLLPMLSLSAWAENELVEMKGCGFCHHATENRVGPPYQEIAGRYSAEDIRDLVKSVREGSSGKWGSKAMPSQRVSDSEAEQMIKWILSIRME